MLPETSLLSIGFILLTFIWAFWLNSAIRFGKWQWLVILVWLALLASLSLNGFFRQYEQLPPPFLVAVLPPFLFSIIAPFTKWGKRAVSQAKLSALTLLHSGRILVELVFLLQLAKMGLVSDIMTFHGRNLDIIPGITALFIWFFCFKKPVFSKSILLLWNIFSICILLFTISQAVITAPTPFQLTSFEQPTIAVFYFPFIWLPGFVAPMMIFSHIIVFHRYAGLNKFLSKN